MKKICLHLLMVCLASLFAFSSAFGWGSATHAFIAERINNKGPLLKLNQVYGSMGADVFNFMFDQPELSIAPHWYFMPVWKAAVLPTGKALAYGFVSHNLIYGADLVAHYYASPLEAYPVSGYIYDRAAELEGKVLSDSYFGPLYQALPIDHEIKMELLRDIVEYGVDVLIKRSDPLIGQKVMSAGLLRSPEFPLMLATGYAKGFAGQLNISPLNAAKLIMTAEGEFRKTTISYGQVLTQEESVTIQLISEQLTALASSFPGVPPGLPSEYVQPLVTFALQKSVDICAGSYAGEMTYAIQFVKAGLQANHISY